MKTIYMVRHAKSSWDNFSINDFDRPLNERGKRDAPAMAKRMHEEKIKIDTFISSPAKRALKTCVAFCKEYDVKKKDIILIEELYHASAENFKKVITALSDDFKKVAIFSHNPGITDFVNMLCPDVHIDNMPTCSVFAVEADTKRWETFFEAEKKHLFFYYPKQLL